MVKPGQEFSPLANCHAKGIFSIPLYTGADYVRRMFIDTLGNCHTIAPHSHRYGLTLEVVSGHMAHHVWVEEEDGPVPMYEFRWESPVLDLPGRFVLERSEVTRWAVDTTHLQQGDKAVELACYEVHSLNTLPGTCWIVTEYEDECEYGLALHSQPTYSPDLSGLYTPIEA